MPTSGDGAGQFKDPAARQIKWVSDRERFAAIATGLRVVSAGHGRFQVQILELDAGGLVRVASVVPADVRHMQLYRQLITPESEWGKEEEDAG